MLGKLRRSGWAILIAALALIPRVAFGDSADVSSRPLAMLDGSSLTGKTSEKSKEIGAAASEVLRGNGSRAGYVLGHGNVIPGSEWIFVGLKRARPNADYSIDYASGSIYFVEAVRQSDSIKADYRYSENAKSDRSLAGASMMPLRFGNSLQTNLTYSYRAVDPEKSGSPDMLTYGMNTTTTLGNSSSISSLMYIATPQTTNRLALSGTPGARKAKSDAPAVKGDRLMVQDADLGIGKVVRLKLGLQDVGEDFAGFSSLRDSKATKDDVLGMLEKEKGLKRTNIGIEVPTGNAAGFSFSTGGIADKQDRISSQAFGFTSSAFKIDYNTRDIGKTFARFTDLREADRAQMAAESGIKRTNYGLHLATGSEAPDSPVWSGVNVTQLQDESGGALTCRSTQIELGPVKVETDTRDMDLGFSKMTSLNDEERVRMATIARRQFDPNAQASQVSAEDKAQMNKEGGLNRRNVGVEVVSGPGKIWLGLASANSENGGLARRDISFQGKGYTLYFGRQRIDEGFDRIAHMQAVEQARFGNETGMSRTETSGNFKLSFGEVALFHAGVTDHQNAGVSRSSVDFKNTRLKFHANFQDIDPEFSRITDLSDMDRQLMLQEKGFNKSDYAINLQVTKALNIDSYIYGSTNSTAEQTRSQNRHKITYTPDKGPQVTAIKDDFSYISESGNLSSYRHQKISFDKFQIMGGLLFKGMHDVNTNQENNGQPVTTDVTQARLESDQNARTSYTLDTLQTDFGDKHRFEDSWDLGAKTQLMRSFKLTGGVARVAREDNNSEVNGRVGCDWQVKKDLSVSLNVANRDGGLRGSQQSKQFSMKGSLFKRMLMFRDVNVDSGMNTTQLKGKQVSCDNGLKVDAGMMSGKATFDNSDKLNPTTGVYYTSRVTQYESDSNPKKPYHVRFFRQDLITPSGELARKRNYALDARLSENTGFTLTSYFGKDGQNGAALPLGGTVFKITRSLNSKLSLIADFTADRNEATERHARTMGFGFTGTLSDNAGFEVYAGWCHLIENGPREHDRVFRLKYDRKVDSDHFFSVIAQKRSAVERSSINPFEGDATARVDFKTLFN